MPHAVDSTPWAADDSGVSWECIDRRLGCPSCYDTPEGAARGAVALSTGQNVYTYTTPSNVTTFRIGDCPKGSHINPYGANCIPDFADEFRSGEFFKDVGIAAASVVATVASAGTASPWVAAANYANQAYQALSAGGVINMGIDLGGIFGGVANIAGGLSSGNYLGALQGAAQVASTFTQAASPTYAQMVSAPIYSPPAVMAAPMVAQPVMSASPVIAAAAGAIARVTAPILTKIAVKLGLRSRPSLTRAMTMIRKGAKLLTSPEALSAALGITVAELATLITASNSRKRRSMNPANSKALRRAARRIKSFHRLCTHTDVLRSRGRRSTGSRCGSCKKSPCRC